MSTTSVRAVFVNVALDTMRRWPAPFDLERYLQSELNHGLKRWSLHELASHHALSTPTTSQRLLQSVVERLAWQHHALQNWIHSVSTSPTTHGTAYSGVSAATVTKPLETLRYIHQDTFSLGRQLLDTTKIWERFNDADKHVIHSTFLEIRARHANTIETVVDIVTTTRRQSLGGPADSNTTTPTTYSEQAAEEFLQRRLGIQLLCDHHVELFKGKKSHGGIAVDAPLSVSLTDAVLEAQHIVDVHLQVYPETVIEPDVTSLSTLTCTMVQPWVHHALVELLKNAMASTVARTKQERLVNVPPLYIRVTPARTSTQNDGNHNNDVIAVEIIDQGTGVADMASALRLGHSTAADRKWDRLDHQQSYAAVRSPLSSLGVGLPVSRYMMEHFGGSVHLINNNNSARNTLYETGCTATILLPMNGTILERIPGEKNNCEVMQL
jgi:pyruvate dehydrogenase kinase 2/3/4